MQLHECMCALCVCVCVRERKRERERERERERKGGNEGEINGVVTTCNYTTVLIMKPLNTATQPKACVVLHTQVYIE